MDPKNPGRLHMVYPELPPTSNKLYFRGTCLTTAARTYKIKCVNYLVREYFPLISALDKDAVYATHLSFFFPTLENASYYSNDKPLSKRAKSRYKKIDLDNRIKLLNDCIKVALDIDDCQTFASSQEKHQDPLNPRVEIFILEVPGSMFGVR